VKVTLLLSVAIDPDHVATIARHRQIAEADVLRELANLIELRAADSVRYLDGVVPPVSVRTVVQSTAGALVSGQQ
jgi:hypothetical protein